MQTSALHTAIETDPTDRVYPLISRDSWVTALLFMLSLALTGLAFYPALIISIAMMVSAYGKTV